MIETEISQLEIKVENESKSTLKDKALGFAVDAAANAVYWQPFLALNEMTWMGYSFEESRNARAGHFGLQLIMGRYYCRALDLGRRLLNKPKYNEEVYGIRREKRFFSHVRDFMVDLFSTSVYWGILMIPVLRYLNDFTWEETGINIAFYSIPNAIGVYPFSRFLDWSRRTFNKKQYGG
jgi:hypothetical protein